MPFSIVIFGFGGELMYYKNVELRKAKGIWRSAHNWTILLKKQENLCYFFLWYFFSKFVYKLFHVSQAKEILVTLVYDQLGRHTWENILTSREYQEEREHRLTEQAFS